MVERAGTAGHQNRPDGQITLRDVAASRLVCRPLGL